MTPPIILLDESQEESVERVGPFAIVNNYPYYRYRLLGRDDAWARHPSALGGAFQLIAESGDFEKLDAIVDEAMKSAVSLENGGITWYYPEVYPLARMRGPKLQYSALSQSSLLAAAMRMEADDPEKYGQFLEQTARGLEFDYHKGGVLWQDSVFLEMPLFHSPPEIILNGWIHALLNYGDYVATFPSAENRRIFDNNIKYLVELLPSFDDPEHNISLYSNATPLRLKLDSGSEALRADFESLDDNFPDYFMDIEELELPSVNGEVKAASYDTQIREFKKGNPVITVTCNRLYNTKISSEKPFEAQYYRAVFDRKRATPNNNKETIVLRSQKAGNRHEIVINAETDGVFCGYGTNFAKPGGKNLYHAYHVVGLAYLATHSFVSEQQREILLEYVRKWDEYTSFHVGEGRVFYPYDQLLMSMNGRKLVKSSLDWEELRAKTIDAD
ncbi:hypothetical protein RA27_00875 [Ruegeria sp. ANG-R]|nr:hypothetical protein RA27_00875 [Ruegeria sp. ANG-R]